MFKVTKSKMGLILCFYNIFVLRSQVLHAGGPEGISVYKSKKPLSNMPRDFEVSFIFLPEEGVIPSFNLRKYKTSFNRFGCFW